MKSVLNKSCHHGANEANDSKRVPSDGELKQDQRDFAYRRLEAQLRDRIDSGQLAPGEKLPSLRQLCRDSGWSKSTVLTAYGRLEAEGQIVARPRSGFFVALTHKPVADELKPSLAPPQTSNPEIKPAPVAASEILVDIMRRGAAFDLLPLDVMSTGGPTNIDLGNLELRRSLARAQRRQTAAQQNYYDQPQGLSSLRETLAARSHLAGCQLKADDLLVTSGCQHSLLLALMASTQPGDLVAVESPGFYGALQLIQSLGLQVLELPCDSVTGLSIDALDLALQHWPVKALLLSSCFATPTGSAMPDHNKARLMQLAEQYDLCVIEDDIYGDLAFSSQRPRNLRSFDSLPSKRSRVIVCSSLSKSLSRDLRLGWIVPGRYGDQVSRLKLITGLASSQTLQQGVDDYLSRGEYDRFLRHKRDQLKLQAQQLQQLILEHLPMTMAVSQPKGGLCLWLELPESVNTVDLYQQALKKGIVLTPGRLFSAQDKYLNCLRMSFSMPWTAPRVDALAQLGRDIAKA